MKRAIFSVLVFIACIAGSYAQSTIPLKVYVEDFPQPFPESAKTQMVNKLHQMLTSNGIASLDVFNDFLLTVVANPVEKIIAPGNPAQIIQSLDFTFYIVDANRQLIYATHTISSKGVGASEARSYIDAMKRVNVKSKDVSAFLDNGRLKIISYYEEEADNIFAKVQLLAKQHKFDEAFYNLCSFPSECSRYLESLQLGNDIYQSYVNYTAQVNLNKAKAVWAASQDASGAAEAGAYLVEILPEASVYGEAQALYNEIKAKVLEDWKWEMKVYQDGVNLEEQRINAWKEVGIAYGRNQKPTTTNIAWLK